MSTTTPAIKKQSVSSLEISTDEISLQCGSHRQYCSNLPHDLRSWGGPRQGTCLWYSTLSHTVLLPAAGTCAGCCMAHRRVSLITRSHPSANTAPRAVLAWPLQGQTSMPLRYSQHCRNTQHCSDRPVLSHHSKHMPPLFCHITFHRLFQAQPVSSLNVAASVFNTLHTATVPHIAVPNTLRFCQSPHPPACCPPHPDPTL